MRADAARMLRDLREAVEADLEQLADASGLTVGWLRALERDGLTRASTWQRIGAALEALDCRGQLGRGGVGDRLIAAADGDLKPEGPAYPDSPGRARRRAEEAERQRRRELLDRLDTVTDIEGMREWAAEAIPAAPSALHVAADMLEGGDDGD